MKLIKVVSVLVLHAELGQPSSGVESGALTSTTKSRTPNVCLEPVRHVAGMASVVAALEGTKKSKKNPIRSRRCLDKAFKTCYMMMKISMYLESFLDIKNREYT